MPTTTTIWTFSAMDSLFFRDGRPMNSGESAWVDSQFPPSGRTMQGAIRAAVLDYLDADIRCFQQGRPCFEGGSLKEEIGSASSLGNLRLTGPFVAKDRESSAVQNCELFFPVPLDLVFNNSNTTYALLKPSDTPVKSDQGTLPFPAVDGAGYKNLKGKYISSGNLQDLLEGTINDPDPVRLIADSGAGEGLADREPKVGLARNNTRRVHEEGMLFAIAPVRPRKTVRLKVQVEGISLNHCPGRPFLQKVGGEGKLAAVQVSQGGSLVNLTHSIRIIADRLRFKIILLSPALLSDDDLLSVPDPADPNGSWQAEINGAAFIIISACIGKPEKIGGWDLAAHCSNPFRPFIPAGSVFFCEADPGQEDTIAALHNSKIGRDTEYGFGHILIGQW